MRSTVLHVLIFVVAFIGLTPTLPACSPAKDASAVVHESAVFAYTGAVAALEVLDAREAAYADTLNSTMAAELEATERRVQRLERARAALAVVRAWLSGERSEGDARAAMRDAVTDLLLAADEAESHGKKVPPSVRQGLETAASWLGAA